MRFKQQPPRHWEPATTRKLQKIHNQPHQQVFLLGVTRGDQQGQGHQAVVVEAGVIEEIVLPQEEHEEEGPDPLVAAIQRQN